MQSIRPEALTFYAQSSCDRRHAHRHRGLTSSERIGEQSLSAKRRDGRHSSNLCPRSRTKRADTSSDGRLAYFSFRGQDPVQIVAVDAYSGQGLPAPPFDKEREFVAGNLAETWKLTREQYLRCAEPVFNAQTATGQEYYSDSRMLFLELNQGAVLKAGATEVPAKLQ